MALKAPASRGGVAGITKRVNSEGETPEQEMARLQQQMKDPSFAARIPAMKARMAALKGGQAKQAGKGLGKTLQTQAPQVTQENIQGQMGVANTANDLAQQQLNNFQQFSYDPRGDRSRIEDEVYGRLTRNTDRDYQREKEQLEQTLYNRGISLDPNDPQYKAHMGALNERYDALKANARADATALGGQEMTRDYGIASGTHNTNMQDTQTLAGMGQNNTPAELDLAYKQMQIQRQQVQNQRPRGGVAQETSPFNTGTPPGV